MKAKCFTVAFPPLHATKNTSLRRHLKKKAKRCGPSNSTGNWNGGLHSENEVLLKIDDAAFSICFQLLQNEFCARTCTNGVRRIKVSYFAPGVALRSEEGFPCFSKTEFLSLTKKEGKKTRSIGIRNTKMCKNYSKSCSKNPRISQVYGIPERIGLSRFKKALLHCLFKKKRIKKRGGVEG